MFFFSVLRNLAIAKKPLCILKWRSLRALTGIAQRVRAYSLFASLMGSHDAANTSNFVSINNTRLLHNLGTTTLLWVQGHKGIPGNELADTEVKKVTATTSDLPRPILYSSA